MTKTSEKMFFFSYAIYLFYTIFNASFFSLYIFKYEKIVMILCAVLTIYGEMNLKKISKKELLLLMFCTISLGILLLHLNGLSMFPLFIYIYAARKISFKNIAKFTEIESSIILILIIISAKLGIINNYKAVTVEFGTMRIRTYLGFRYALFPQMILFNITLCSIYAHKDNLKFSRCLILIILNYWMFTYTDARLSCYLSIILTLFIYLFNKKERYWVKRKILAYILICSFPICALTCFFATATYDNTNIVMRQANEVMGGRLKLGKMSLSQYKINLLGNDTRFIGAGLDINGKRSKEKSNFVDCLYINMLEKYGIIFNIMFLLFLTYVVYKAWKRENYFLFFILIGLALRGIIDNLEMYLYYNAFWLSIGELYVKKNNRNNKYLKNMEGQSG